MTCLATHNQDFVAAVTAGERYRCALQQVSPFPAATVERAGGQRELRPLAMSFAKADTA